MNQVHLVGDIGNKFGHEWSMNISNFGEILRLIDCQTEGLKKYLIDAEENDIGFTVQRADEYINDEKELLLNLNNEDIIIAAVPLGAGKKHGFFGSGIGKIIIGAFLYWVGFMMGDMTGSMAVKVSTALQSIGTMLVLQGVTQLLAPTAESEKEEEGWLMSGSANTVTQGQPVPLCYGEALVPGSPINVSYSNRPFNLGYLQYGDSPVDANGNIISGDIEGTSYEDVQIIVSGGTLVGGGDSFNDNIGGEYIPETIIR